MTIKIESSVNNIVLVSNFMAEEYCKEIIADLTSSNALTVEGMWKDRIFAEFSFGLSQKKILKGHRFKLKNFVKTQYGYEVYPNSLNQHIVKWSTGESMESHVDEHGENSSHNNISAILYLNDDYEGGEIYFKQFDLTIKPKAGDLVCFPGNEYYAHEVKPILSGTRYTAPAWYRFA